MTANDIIENTIKPIAKEAHSDALEILQLIAVLKAQNTNNVNKALSKAGAGGAAIAMKNAAITRLTLLVSRCYSKTKDGDRHVRRAFEIISKDPRVNEELSKRASGAAVKDALADWSLRRGDHRLQRIDHFRDKYTAHLSTPDPNVPIPNYEDLFAFAEETADLMQSLVKISGINNHSLSDWDAELKETATAFWGPWATAKPT